MSGGKGGPARQGPLGGQSAPAVHAVDGGPQADGGADGAQPPHGVVGGRCGRLPLQGEERLGGGLGEPPAGVAQPHLVGREQQDAAGLRPLGEPPEALGEARPIGGRPLPDDGYGASSGEGHGGVHRHGSIPLEADGIGRVRYGGGDAVDDGHGVEAFQEDAPPAGRDGQVSQQALQSLTRT